MLVIFLLKTLSLRSFRVAITNVGTVESIGARTRCYAMQATDAAALGRCWRCWTRRGCIAAAAAAAPSFENVTLRDL